MFIALRRPLLVDQAHLSCRQCHAHDHDNPLRHPFYSLVLWWFMGLVWLKGVEYVEDLRDICDPEVDGTVFGLCVGCSMRMECLMLACIFSVDNKIALVSVHLIGCCKKRISCT